MNTPSHLRQETANEKKLLHSPTYEELHAAHEINTLGLQYTIAERERLKLLFRLIGEMRDKDSPNIISKIIRKIFKAKATCPEIIFRIMQSVLHSQSERFQDIFALLANKGKQNGFFVEFGACNGLHASNTLILEREFGWRGILAEPDYSWHDSLQKNRTAKIDKRCVSSVTGGKLELFQSSHPGNSSVDKNHKYINNILESYIVETVSLMDLLKHHNAPRLIDFLSVDTEGHEKEAFTNFDFQQYKFGFICVEQHEHVTPDNQVQPLLEAAGYKVIFPRAKGRPVPMQITEIDLFFVPNNHPWATKYSEAIVY